MKFLYTSILLGLLLFLGCNNNNKTVSYAYLGGEIINPSKKYIVVYKGKTLLDTVKLDGRNRFIYKVEKLNPGLYTFYHGGEVQVVLLEPRDSVMLRINTLEFDESLVFTGIGAKKNNFLINDFLENENLERNIFKYCALSPSAYQEKMDSIKDDKLERLLKFEAKNNNSDLFKSIALANINYNYYTAKEVYPFVHYGKNKGAILDSIPSNFYSYRNNINYNDTVLQDYHYYRTFLKHNVNNEALFKHIKKDPTTGFNRYSVCFNLDRLEIIDSLITNPSIKNDLLYKFTVGYLSKSDNIDSNNKMLESYLTKATDKAKKENMKLYAKSLSKLKVGNSVPSLLLVNYNNKEIELETIVNKPSVLSFWSHKYYEHFLDSHKKLKELRLKYPEVNFIIVNVDDYDLEISKKALEKNKFPTANEFLFKTPETSKQLLAVQPITKVLILDRHKRIVNNNTNIFSVKFEEQLLGAINR